jgi:hypothetical protein
VKNIHVLPTQNEITSKLFKVSNELKLTRKYDFYNGAKYQNIYITSDEEIKEGDWCYQVELNDGKVDKCYDVTLYHTWTNNGVDKTRKFKKIILTTDTNLIKDSVQVIDDKFLEWFVKNPNCEKIEIKTKYLHSYKTGENFISFSKTPEFSSRNMQCIKIEPRYEIIIPQEESKQMSKQTAVEWLIEEMHKNIVFIPVPMQEKAKEMEKEQSQAYAAFSIGCHMSKLKILEFNDYLKLYENEVK